MLYRYVKAEIVRRPEPSSLEITIKKKKSPLTIIITFFCLSSGIALLTYSLFPYAKNYSKKLFGDNVNKAVLDPDAIPIRTQGLSTASAKREISSSYVENVSRNIDTTNKLLQINSRTFPEYSSIEGTMYVTIPKLNLEKLPVMLNVDSFNPDVYMKQLDLSLAHFRGTSLPDKDGNTFIYGHSANELLARTDPTNPRLAFTFLPELDIGDEIIIEYNSERFVYSTQKARLVEPEDISPIYSTSDSRILTLMTCYPPGIGSQRFILTAKLIETVALN